MKAGKLSKTHYKLDVTKRCNGVIMYITKQINKEMSA